MSFSQSAKNSNNLSDEFQIIMQYLDGKDAIALAASNKNAYNSLKESKPKKAREEYNDKNGHIFLKVYRDLLFQGNVEKASKLIDNPLFNCNITFRDYHKCMEIPAICYETELIESQDLTENELVLKEIDLKLLRSYINAEIQQIFEETMYLSVELCEKLFSTLKDTSNIINKIIEEVDIETYKNNMSTDECYEEDDDEYDNNEHYAYNEDITYELYEGYVSKLIFGR